jgi:LL-diaminopimelate aminotransferase
MNVADRVAALPPYLFARIEKKIEECKSREIDVISLGIGDPDLPTPPHIVQALKEQADNPANHRYPSSVGLPAFRRAVTDWYLKRFDVLLDPGSEVVTLIGSKEGIAHISFCYLNPGDCALIPDPGYPVYGIGAALAGAESYMLPLKAERGFLPDLAAVPADVARRAKILWLNYPNNPTGAVASLDFFQEAVSFARSFDLIICHDAPYTEITFDGYIAPSFLQAPGAREVGIEFHSLSKTYNMTGWRLGWAAGNAEIVRALGSLKSNLDSGAFQAVQYAGIAALTGPQTCVQQMRQVYQERRDIVVSGLRSLGWRVDPPRASIYVWAPVPPPYTSEEFAELVLEKSGVVLTQGNGYGATGEGWFRISLTTPTERLIEAFRRLKETFGTP